MTAIFISSRAKILNPGITSNLLVNCLQPGLQAFFYGVQYRLNM